MEGSTAGFGQLVCGVERAARIGRDACRKSMIEWPPRAQHLAERSAFAPLHGLVEDPTALTEVVDRADVRMRDLRSDGGLA